MAKVLVDALTRYKADTSDHIRGLKKLKGEEKKRNEALVKQLEEQESKLEKQIQTWGKVAGAVAAFGAAVVVAKESFAAYQEDVSLRAGSAGADLESLRESSQGLVSDTDLMRVAQAGLQGDFKLTKSEMDDVAKSLVALRGRGIDMQEAVQAVGDALREDNIEPLKKLGIQLGDNLEMMGAANETYEAQQVILQGLREETAAYGETGSLANDDVSKALVAAENATRDFKVELGRLVAFVLKEVLPVLTKIVKSVAELPENVRRLSAEVFNAGVRDPTRLKAIEIQKELRFREGTQEGGFLRAAAKGPLQGVPTEVLRKRLATLEFQIKAEFEAKRTEFLLSPLREFTAEMKVIADNHELATKREMAKAVKEREKRAAAQAKKSLAERRKRLRKAIGVGAGAIGGFGGTVGGLFRRGAERAGEFAEQQRQQRLLELGGLAESASDLFATTFGDVGAAAGRVLGTTERRETFESREQEALQKRIEFITNTAQPALDLISGSATAAFTAIVTGSMSASEAVKEFAGQFLWSEGIRLAGLAISSGVQALFNLGIGNVPGAVAAGKAAASAAAGSAALLGLAGLLGVDAPAPGGIDSTTATPTSGAVGAGVRGGARATQVFVLGDGFETATSRERKARLTRAIDQAQVSGAGNLNPGARI